MPSDSVQERWLLRYGASEAILSRGEPGTCAVMVVGIVLLAAAVSLYGRVSTAGCCAALPMLMLIALVWLLARLVLTYRRAGARGQAQAAGGWQIPLAVSLGTGVAFLLSAVAWRLIAGVLGALGLWNILPSFVTMALTVVLWLAIFCWTALLTERALLRAVAPRPTQQPS